MTGSTWYHKYWVYKIHGLTVPVNESHWVQVQYDPWTSLASLFPQDLPLLLHVGSLGPHWHAVTRRSKDCRTGVRICLIYAEIVVWESIGIGILLLQWATIENIRIQCLLPGWVSCTMAALRQFGILALVYSQPLASWASTPFPYPDAHLKCRI